MWATGLPPDVWETFCDFADGAMFVVEDVQPPLTEAELAERIAAMRWQPDFADRQYNETAVVGLTPNRGGEGFVSLAVLVRNPCVDYAGQPEAWRPFAEGELNLLTEALRREDWLEPVKPGPRVAMDVSTLPPGVEHWYVWVPVIVLGGAFLVYVWVRRGRRKLAQQPREGK